MADPTSVLLGLAAVSAVAGFAWLALAMEVHGPQVLGGKRPLRASRAVLRTLGVGGLAASALFCFLADRPSMAVLVWLMLLAGAALLTTFMLAWRPRLLRVVWPWGA
jgi:hypothetical protein